MINNEIYLASVNLVHAPHQSKEAILGEYSPRIAGYKSVKI
jgi:hypothetical protein